LIRYICSSLIYFAFHALVQFSSSHSDFRSSFAVG
jgi:hypothetical protein